MNKKNNNMMLITLLINWEALFEVALSDGSDLLAEEIKTGMEFYIPNKPAFLESSAKQ